MTDEKEDEKECCPVCKNEEPWNSAGCCDCCDWMNEEF